MDSTRDQLVKVASPQVGKEEVAAVREVLLSGRYVSGSKVKEFERLFADYIGVKYAVAVNSGTAALQAALVAIGVGAGDEVIVPALTFFSTATSVIHQNAVPVFADILLDSYCMDPADFERRITPRTKAVIPVHYFGHAVEMDRINEIAARYCIKVIEDCAQSHGTLYKGQQTGAMGDLGAFSFFATKHMTTGEGGAITTNNPEWAELMKQFRSHGMKGRNDHILLGYNYRMTEMAGAMGIVQLGKLDALNEARICVSEALIERLEDIPWLTLPQVPNHVRHTYFWLHAWIDEEKLGFSTQELIARLREKKVEVRHRYLEPLYRQRLLQPDNPYCPFNGLQYRGVDIPAYDEMYLPNAEKVAGCIIGLPNRPDMTLVELDRVVEVLHTIHL
jgi:dTDP-4-amino-4,6-dideoxygalactose transaminase